MVSGQNVVILGGDGFCGWPAALHLSAAGHEVTIVDNFSRRRIDTELGTEPLAPIAPIETRIRAWQEVSGRTIRFTELDVRQDYEALEALFCDLQPSTIVHFAEQRSAPYSMLSSKTRRYSVENNVSATHNVLVAISQACARAHLIHLGTIGVYGYATAGLKLPEGYLPITAKGSDGREIHREVLYPGEPDSVYHMTKALDQQLFAFYARQNKLRCTDLHQGVVWGSQTSKTLLDARLVNRFDYDAIYGTVVNRFLVQAATGHPLTVYGTGQQTRGFIHLEDSVWCIERALQTPPAAGDRVRIINQVAETHGIASLASAVSKLTGAEIRFVPNPREEPVGNEFEVDRNILTNLGLKARTFESSLRDEADFVAGQARAVKIERLAPGGWVTQPEPDLVAQT
jgi:UDP-sulfoquinovose synthase